MSYSFYWILHLVGILMLFMALGGVILHVLNGGDKAGNKGHKIAVISHGIGLFLMLLGGFGMLAKLKIAWPWPGWLLVKIVVWVILGGMMTVVYKQPDRSKWMWWVMLFWGLLAVLMVAYKPF